MAAVTLENARSRRGTGRFSRSMRKHRVALVVIGLYLGIFFFPSVFMGRVVSPNDVYRHYEPWTIGHDFVAQNPVIHDPPMAYMPIAAMMKRAPESFHWNPWLAAGIPGWGSAASALLTPFVLIPALLPLSLFYTVIILTKLVFAFWMSYLWLREERLGKAGAAAGALVGAACGPMFALWLWQSTNATVLYPALLFSIARMSHGKRNSLVFLTALAVAFLLSGYPAAIVFGVWLGLFYSLVKFALGRRFPAREMLRAVLAAALALMITAPVLDPFISFLGRTGYLDWRETMSSVSLPPEHLIGFLDVDYLGDAAKGLWRGDPRLGPLNNQIELTIWVGPLAAIIALLALLDRRARWRVLAWLAFAGIMVAIMVGLLRFEWILELPGFRYSPTTRLRTLLPPAFAFLVAAGARWVAGLFRSILPIRGSVAVLILGAILSIQYARVAAGFYPYLPLAETRVEAMPSLERLQVNGAPFRVAPTFFWMMPNSAQLYGVEDIRSQWSSESVYREMIRRIDRQALSHGTVLLLNGLSMDVDDPFLKLLNVRYVVEPPAIDILRWKIEEKLEAKPAPDRDVVLSSGESASAVVRISARAKSIVVTARPADRSDTTGRVDVDLIRPETGEVLRTVSRSIAQLVYSSKISVPLGGVAGGEAVEVRMTARAGEIAVPYLEGAPFARESFSSLGFAWENENARIYEIVDTLPRYRAVWDLVQIPAYELLDDTSIDLTRVATVERLDPELKRWIGPVPRTERHVDFRVLRYSPSDQVVETISSVPFLFYASEKLTPELSVFLDGREIEPMLVNGLFVGFPVAPGKHRIVLERRIGGRWWLASILGFLGLGVAGVFDSRW